MLISEIPQKEHGTPYNVPLLPVRLKRFDLCRNRDGQPVRHWHEDTQLMTVSSGSVHMRIERTDIRLSEGDFLMISPRRGHPPPGPRALLTRSWRRRRAKSCSR